MRIELDSLLEFQHLPCTAFPGPPRTFWMEGSRRKLVDRIADDGKRSGVRDQAARRALRSLALSRGPRVLRSRISMQFVAAHDHHIIVAREALYEIGFSGVPE
jgi:hypothetical protein